MDDEFALCWNNFQDNIATGFQNLYDRGDLVDVTLACDGKLLHAHKIVLAICSPYFQEMFNSNPCKHPIIILKDVAFGVMCELLQFMYQGVVNVKHTELQTFMKIAQMLQIKGLASNSSSSPSAQKSPSQVQNANSSARNSSAGSNNGSNSNPNNDSSHSNIDQKVNLTQPSTPSTSSSTSQSLPQIKASPEGSASSPIMTGPGLKRLSEFSTESLSIYARKQFRRNTESSDHDINNDSVDHMNPDDVFMPQIPHISMMEPRFDLNNVKRESSDYPGSPSSMRSALPPPPMGFDYNAYTAAKNVEYPNDLHMPNDYSKSNFGNHMDIPPSGTSITMLSSTSLLHGNCVFNRNNTVATQQGMKTYWLCKSYRITMCRARCITHQGRVISATGVHNHPPHMKNGPSGGNEMMPPQLANAIPTSGSNNPPLAPTNMMQVPVTTNVVNMRLPQAPNLPHQHSLIAGGQQQQQMHHQHQQQQSSIPHHQLLTNPMSHHHLQHQPPPPPPQNTVIQNMMHNVNLMHLSNMTAPMINPQPPQHSPQVSGNVQLTPIISNSPNMHSPSNRTGGGGPIESPSMHQQPSSVGPMESPSSNQNETPGNMSEVERSPMSNSNCPSVSQDSGSQHMMESMTISPEVVQQQHFKIENM